MAIAEDDRPRDSLGRPKRRLRYPVTIAVKISEDARDTLEEMAQDRSSKARTIARRAIMKEIYIYKRKKEQRSNER